jgi:hypothetical protein
MADTVPVTFSVTVIDHEGVEASAPYYALADPTKTIANMLADWQATALLIDGVTAGQILRGKITVGADIGAFVTAGGKSAPIAGSLVEHTGVFNYSNAVTGRRFGLTVPALSQTKVVSGKIDLADAAVAALIAGLKGAIAIGHWVNTAEQSLVALVDALVSFRKRRRQLERSFERP